ncbi:type II toxin-antitoxin system HicA family toxin [Adlercreutzia sp. R7]|uniref:Type II toxin-antitoxin system HicA family toxin n=1 Tax=Adlercreutzia wanghongyangiae TaxID=3111451 RepID=A0ABU6IGS1_9ACTN|nr:type II toxin-antitoxin system HicA family toxin [Adlercreutzia sp. R7]
MTQIEKLLGTLLSMPSTYRFRDFVRIMEHLGYELDQKRTSSGSRVRFYREEDGRMLLLHSPHPSDEMSRGAIRAAVKFLGGEETP